MQISPLNICGKPVNSMGTSPDNITSLAYIERDGCYLLMHRTKKKNDENSGKWIGVGGHFEPGEAPDDCMKREVREECGITPDVYSYRGIVTFVSDEWGTEYMHLFTVTGWKGEFCLDCDEGFLEFVAKDKIASLPMWEGDRIFLSLIAHDCPFFNLRLEYQKDKLVYAEKDGAEIPL